MGPLRAAAVFKRETDSDCDSLECRDTQRRHFLLSQASDSIKQPMCVTKRVTTVIRCLPIWIVCLFVFLQTGRETKPGVFGSCGSWQHCYVWNFLTNIPLL